MKKKKKKSYTQAGGALRDNFPFSGRKVIPFLTGILITEVKAAGPTKRGRVETKTLRGFEKFSKSQSAPPFCEIRTPEDVTDALP